MIQLASRLNVIAPSATKAFTSRAKSLNERGLKITVLTHGEADFGTPSNICAAGVAAINYGHTRYTDSAGILALRQAVARKLRRENNLQYSANEVTIGCGAKQIIFNTLLCTLNPGDEVIIPSPCWVSYPELVKLVGGVPRFVQCRSDDGYQLRADALEAAISSRTKWLILNNPHNPTGAVYSREELTRLGKVLQRHPGVAILSDEVYEKLIHAPGKFTSFGTAVPELVNQTMLVNGVSKAFNMTGWRVGYGAGPPTLIAAMNLIQGQTASQTSTISQHAAIEALDSNDSILRRFNKLFTERRNVAVSILEKIQGFRIFVPQGAFYLFVECNDILKTLGPIHPVKDDVGLALHLLEDARVAVVPGSAFFGGPGFRLSLTVDSREIADACSRIADSCKRLLDTT